MQEIKVVQIGIGHDHGLLVFKSIMKQKKYINDLSMTKIFWEEYYLIGITSNESVTNMIKIIPVKYAESTLPESMVFCNGDKNKLFPIVFLVYLIITDKKTILVDAGCETMPGFVMKKFIGPINALGRVGIQTSEITDVIITHAHHDHIECVKYFENAVLHIQKEEYLNGKKYIPDDALINVFENECKITDDVKVIKIGGHSVGSCVVEVDKDEFIYVIAGDECYSRKCIENHIVTGSSYCIEKSTAFLEKYDKEKYKILCCHEDGEI